MNVYVLGCTHVQLSRQLRHYSLCHLQVRGIAFLDEVSWSREKERALIFMDATNAFGHL
jgi:hypothetical protein